MRTSGGTQFHFESGAVHSFSVWGEQLSLVLLPNPLTDNMFGHLYKLSHPDQRFNKLQRCLNQACQDIRIWTLHEDIETDEAKQVAVSYLLSNGLQLFYCIYLHQDLSADYLLLDVEVDKTKVENCFSVGLDTYIDW